MPLPRASLKHRLTAIAMVTTTVALLLATGVFVVYDYVTFRQQQTSDLRSLADMLAAGSSAALSAAEPLDADGALTARRARHDVTRAYVLTAERRVFAKYHRDDIADTGQPPRQLSDLVGADRVAVARPVVRHGEQVGTIYLEADR